MAKTWMSHGYCWQTDPTPNTSYLSYTQMEKYKIFWVFSFSRQYTYCLVKCALVHERWPDNVLQVYGVITIHNKKARTFSFYPKYVCCFSQHKNHGIQRTEQSYM